MDRRYFKATDRANEVARLFNVIAMNRAVIGECDYLEMEFIGDLDNRLSEIERGLQSIINSQMERCGTQQS